MSLIIPVYNVDSYIAECVQSMIRRTYTGSLECVLMDDCGTDGSIAIAEEIIDKYDGPIKFRVLLYMRNRVLSSVRDMGTKAVTGDYMYYLDSDDYL